MSCQPSSFLWKKAHYFGVIYALFLLSACPLQAIDQPPTPDAGMDVVDDQGLMDLPIDDSNTSDDGGTIDEGVAEDTNEPPSLFTKDSRSIWSMRLDDSEIDRCFPLGNEDFLALTDSGLHWMGSPGALSLTVPENFDASDIVAVDQSGLGHIVVATSEALYVTVGDELVLSPLSDALNGTTIIDIIVARRFDGDVIWVATDDGIHRWENDQVQTLDLGDVPSKDVQLAWGAPLNSGMPALWVNAGSHVYAITHNGTSATAWVEQSDVSVDSIHIDGSGRLWMVTETGLELRESDGYWHPEPLNMTVETFLAHRDHVGLYAIDDEGSFHHLLYNTAWQLTEGIDESTSALCADGRGRLIANDSEGVIRFHPWEDLSLAGLADESQLKASLESEPVEINIDLSYLNTEEESLSAEDAGLTADLNGEALELGDSPFRIELDPWLLESGDYVLTLSRTIEGNNPWDAPGEPPITKERSLYFSTERPLVTWADDIQPLSAQFCSACHGPAGHLANDLKFYNYDHWIDEFNVIVGMVEAQLMPPGEPLSPDKLLLLKYWGLSQFQE